MIVRFMQMKIHGVQRQAIWPTFGSSCLLLAGAVISGLPANAQLAHETAPATAAPVGSISAVDVTRSGQLTTVHISGTGALRFQVSQLDSPSRVVLDFSETRLRVGTYKVPSKYAPVMGVRLGQSSPGPGQSRVVIDVDKLVPFSTRSDGSGVSVSFTTSTTPVPHPAPAALHAPKGLEQPKLTAVPEPDTPPPAWLTGKDLGFASPTIGPAAPEGQRAPAAACRQGTGALKGTVEDPAGSAVISDRVALRDSTTGKKFYAMGARVSLYSPVKPAQGINSPFTTYEDANLIDAGAFSIGQYVSFYSSNGGNSSSALGVGFSLGLYCRLELSGYGAAALSRERTNGFATEPGDSYVAAKLLLASERRYLPALAVRPALEVLGNPAGGAGTDVILPLILQKNVRLCDLALTTGYVTRGVAFSALKCEWNITDRITPMAVVQASRLTKDLRAISDLGLNRTELHGSGGLDVDITPHWSFFLEVGRAFGRMDANSSHFDVTAGTSFTGRLWGRSESAHVDPVSAPSD